MLLSTRDDDRIPTKKTETRGRGTVAERAMGELSLPPSDPETYTRLTWNPAPTPVHFFSHGSTMMLGEESESADYWKKAGDEALANGIKGIVMMVSEPLETKTKAPQQPRSRPKPPISPPMRRLGPQH